MKTNSKNQHHCLRVERIKTQVAARVDEFVEFIYRRAVCSGEHWRIGDKLGTPGQSLAITRRGKFAGCGYDFATDEWFNCIDLWMAARDVSFVAALVEMEHWLAGRKTSPSVRPMITKPLSALEPIAYVPRHIYSEYHEGCQRLMAHPEWTSYIAQWRGWPAPFVESLCQENWISLLIGRGAQPAIAFPVHAPSFLNEWPLRFVGYHQRQDSAVPEPSVKWHYRPNEAQDRIKIPALPIVVGDFYRASTLIITEGQWDAFTLILAMNWFETRHVAIPPGVAVVGIRGATAWQVFFRHYAKLWPRDVNVLVFPQRDEAGKKWTAVDGDSKSFCQELQFLCRRVRAIQLTGVNDWNDAWRIAPAEIDGARMAIAEFMNGGVA